MVTEGRALVELEAQRRRLAILSRALGVGEQELASAIRRAHEGGSDPQALAKALGTTEESVLRLLRSNDPTHILQPEPPARSRKVVAAVVVTSFAMMGLVGWVDHITGPFIPLAILYVLPVFAAAWVASRRWGYGVAVASSIVAYTADRSLDVLVQGSYPLWNLVARLTLLVLVAELVHRASRSLALQHELVSREREAVESLREANELKTTLLRALGHDLRDPLTAVFGSAATLTATPEELTKDEVDSLLGGIMAGARRMTRIVDGLLDVDRLQEGGEPQRRLTDVAALVAQVVGEWNAAHHRQVELRAEPAAALVDPVHVERILENLLSNAMRHAGQGDPVVVCVRSEGDRVVLAVDDAGPGVPEEDRERIFELFEAGSSASRPGIGIGLYLVARFAELNGGVPTVSRSPQGGASFKVSFASSV